MENPQYRVLQVVAGMNRGGTETMLMNHYRALDREKVQFDFLVHTDKECAYDREIESLGGRIFHAMPIRPWTYLQYFRWLNNFFAEHAHEFVAVHGHIQENTGFALHYAQKYGIAHRLISSHTAPSTRDYKYIFREFARIFFNKSATTKIACADDSGKYLYRGDDYIVLRNAINTDLFKYNPKTRNILRKQLNISENDIVIGHVGRFDAAKNQRFLVDLFEKLHVKNRNFKLILVGDGITFNDIYNHINEIQISNDVRLLGSRSDVNDILQAIDIFVMPSIYEGLPVSVIEAQASGLPCVLSDTIDKQCDITGNVHFLPLNGPIEKWIDTIISCASKDRQDCLQQIIDAGYDVNNNIKLLLPLYGVQL